MRNRSALVLVVACLSAVLAGIPSAASAQTTVELNLGLGLSVVDLEKWYGGSVVDWNKLTYQGNAQVYFADFGKIRIGAEAGYDYFGWYSVPSGYSWVYTYDIKAGHIGAVGRTEVNKYLFADFGAGVYFFSGGYTNIGIMGGLGHIFKFSERISIPVKVRALLILSDPILIPIGISAGVLVRL